MPEFEICFEEIVIPFDYTRKFSYELAVRAWKNTETGKEGKRKLQIRSLWNPEDGEKNIRNVSTFGDELMDMVLGNSAEIKAIIKGAGEEGGLPEPKEVPF